MSNDDDDYLEGRDHESHLPSSAPTRRESPRETRAGEPPPAEPITIRIASIEELSPTFDTPDGEWQSILAKDDPFAVLYLDARDWHSITEAIVRSRYEILTAFWKRKIMALRSGSREQILRKYGGKDRSEYLVESFPQILKGAFEELSTDEAIRAAGSRLARHRAEAALTALSQRLDLFLVDGELKPLEARALFAESARLGLTDEVTSQFIAAKLSDRRAEPVARPRGATLKEQLCSVAWSVSRARRKNAWTLIALFAALALAVLAYAVIRARQSETNPQPVTPAHSNENTLLAQKTAPQPVPAMASSPSSIPMQAERPPALPVKPKVDLQAERDALAAELQRQSDRQAEQAAQAAHEEIERSRTRLHDLLAEKRFDEVESESERLLTIAARHSLAEDIAAIREIAATARERQVAEKVEQERRERYLQTANQIKRFADSGKYPEAISLSNEILADSQLPADLRDQILQSQAKARTELKRIMGSAVIKGGEVKPDRKH